MIKLNHSAPAKSRRSKKGLTLIELLVVLVILIGIGGLLVPTINNALTRTHVSSCATTFPEVHQMMQRVQLEFGEFGTDFDSGIDQDGTAVNGTNFEALSADQAAALAAVGITSVIDHDAAATATGFNVTFNINPDGDPARTLADGENVITLTQDQAQSIFLDHDGVADKYVWFGIGRDWSLLGSLAPEPPVHFGDTAGLLPDEVHSRFGVVFQVADADGDFERAEFKRVSYSLDGADFETGDNHIEVYWEEVSGQ
ncbi:MAG: type II secretion system protein [Verrucomicrobiota bacterium]